MSNRTLAAAILAATTAGTALTLGGLALAQGDTPALPATYGNLLTPIFTGNALREKGRGDQAPFRMGLDVTAVGLVVVLASGGDGGDGSGSDPGDFPEEAHIQTGSGFIHDYTPDDREGTTPPELEQGNLDSAAKAAGCELQQNLPDEGSEHVQEAPNYKTDPPTSGDHNAEPDYRRHLARVLTRRALEGALGT